MALKRAARDIEFTCMQGTYVADTDVSTARKTRGLGAALTTNKVNAGGDALTQADIDATLKLMADNGAPFEQPVLFANAANKQLISGFYSNSLALAPRDRNIGGVNINTIETDFCEMGVVYERHIPATQVFIVDMAFVKPVFLDIPGKGHFFVEPLAQSGAAYKYQVYGEFGLEYGPEQFHGNIHSTA